MSARSGYDGVLISSVDGMPMAGIQWTVYNAAGTEAQLYSTKSGGAFLAQGQITDSTGLIQFWVDPGYYEIEVDDTIGSMATRRIPFNAVAGGTNEISESQLPLFIDGAIISPDTIEGTSIKANAIDASHIQANAVGESEIGNLEVTGTKVNIKTKVLQVTATSITMTAIEPGIYYGILTSTFPPSGKDGITVDSGYSSVTPGAPNGSPVIPFILNAGSTTSITFGSTFDYTPKLGLTLYGVGY